MFLHLTLTALFFGVSVAVISLDEPHVPENTYETCLTTMDRGDACCPEPNNTIRYYFDPEFQQCFSYLYEGCGGGRNTFYTEYDCRRTCIMADKLTCGPNKERTGSCNVQDMSCPGGSSCVIGGLGGMGICCSNAQEQQWDAESRRPFCRVGRVLLRNVLHGDGQEVWFGRSCAHRFCPFGYECVQGRRFAHCCGPIANFKENFFPENDNFLDSNNFVKRRRVRQQGQSRNQIIKRASPSKVARGRV